MPCRQLPQKGFVLPSNAEIAEALIERFDNFIKGTTVKVAISYRLSPEDKADMRQYFYLKLVKIDWRHVFRKNKLWIKDNSPNHSRNWTATEAAYVLRNYAKQVLQNAVTESLWTAHSSGLTGLGLYKVKPNELPKALGIEQPRDDDSQKHGTVDPEDVQFGRDGQANRTAANQISERARSVLTADEWECISKAFGYDGGGTRTPTQVAHDTNFPRKRTQELLDSAMQKLREMVGCRQH